MVKVLFQNSRPDRPATFEEYCRSGGYQALTLAVRNMAPKEVNGKVTDWGLRGRGGAGFRAGLKWGGVPGGAAFPRYVVANTDEMEPGTFKDRVLVNTDPHMVIEGTILAGFAVSAKRGLFFVRPSYEMDAQLLERELEVARSAGYLGKNIAGSDYSFDIVVHRSGGRYICGEATAQVNAIMGNRPHPLKGGPRMAEKGLWNRPTLVNNVETLACVPHILMRGPEWFKSLARTATGAGTKLYGVSGKVNHPGCFELPMGTRLSEIIEEAAGGMVKGSEFKAVLPGGASTAFMPRQYYDLEMDFDPVKKTGHRLGTGAIVVFDHKTCLVGAALNLTDFFVRESCGLCTPCREGLPHIRELLWKIENGQGREEFIPMLQEMAGYMRYAYCTFAPGAAEPVEGLLRHFEEEVREHISQRKCPFRENGTDHAQARH
ncbi:MAG: complex I 51 kDa subunit family protein [Deltaproteobacteria bacterium]